MLYMIVKITDKFDGEITSELEFSCDSLIDAIRYQQKYMDNRRKKDIISGDIYYDIQNIYGDHIEVGYTTNSKGQVICHEVGRKR